MSIFEKNRLQEHVEASLDNNKRFAEELMHGSYSKKWEDTDYDFSYRSVDSYGGEDCGSEFYNVVEVSFDKEPTGLFLKLEGWYTSYEGATYQDYKWVTPVQKTITVYQ